MKLIKVTLLLNTEQETGQINEMVHDLGDGAARHYGAEVVGASWNVERGGDEA